MYKFHFYYQLIFLYTYSFDHVLGCQLTNYYIVR